MCVWTVSENHFFISVGVFFTMNRTQLVNKLADETHWTHIFLTVPALKQSVSCLNCESLTNKSSNSDLTVNEGGVVLSGDATANEEMGKV